MYILLTHSFLGVLSSESCSLWLLQGECSGFHQFKEQKTEVPMWLGSHMLTRLLLDYIQYYLQYFHAAVILPMYYVLYLTTPPNSHVSSVQILCVYTTT